MTHQFSYSAESIEEDPNFDLLIELSQNKKWFRVRQWRPIWIHRVTQPSEYTSPNGETTTTREGDIVCRTWNKFYSIVDEGYLNESYYAARGGQGVWDKYLPRQDRVYWAAQVFHEFVIVNVAGEDQFGKKGDFVVMDNEEDMFLIPKNLFHKEYQKVLTSNDLQVISVAFGMVDTTIPAIDMSNTKRNTPLSTSFHSTTSSTIPVPTPTPVTAPFMSEPTTSNLAKEYHPVGSNATQEKSGTSGATVNEKISTSRTNTVKEPNISVPEETQVNLGTEQLKNSRVENSSDSVVPEPVEADHDADKPDQMEVETPVAKTPGIIGGYTPIHGKVNPLKDVESANGDITSLYSRKRLRNSLTEHPMQQLQQNEDDEPEFMKLRRKLFNSKNNKS